MRKVIYPNAKPRAYQINWLGHWVDSINPLSEHQFQCFDLELRNLYELELESEDFELIILAHNGGIVEIRGLYPFIYTETHKELVFSHEMQEEIDKKAEAMIKSVPKYSAIIDRIACNMREHEV